MQEIFCLFCRPAIRRTALRVSKPSVLFEEHHSMPAYLTQAYDVRPGQALSNIPCTSDISPDIILFYLIERLHLAGQGRANTMNTEFVKFLT
jgi:hypothetical protein